MQTKSLAALTVMGLLLAGTACSSDSKSDRLKHEQTTKKKVEPIPEGHVLVTFYDDQLLWSTVELRNNTIRFAKSPADSHTISTSYVFPGRWTYGSDGVPNKPMQHLSGYPTAESEDGYLIQVKMRNFWSRFDGQKKRYVRIQPFPSACDNRIVKLAVWKTLDGEPEILSPNKAWAELWRSEADLLDGKPLPACQEPPQR